MLVRHKVGELGYGEAAAALRDGELAILPTDTVYGICADVRRDRAVQAIYTAKGKGSEAPLQLLFGDDETVLERYAELTPAAARLLSVLGPGPWTIITTAREGWESPALAGGRTVGVRMPDAPAIREVVARLGAPLAASSANRHGGPSPTTCEEAVAQVGEFCALAIDSGPTPAGIDSTVIDCSTDDVRILREGAIDRETVARILGLSDIPVLRSVRT
ncbi:MAG TPA: L-threonylcarbamoyladenylate synthase [Tepidiformaceae bacterium]|nr:L-threonylcarbamoyladenylate synthase [Tepidiformaceae bacterium]